MKAKVVSPIIPFFPAAATSAVANERLFRSQEHGCSGRRIGYSDRRIFAGLTLAALMA